MASLTLSIVEIVVLMLGAIVLGITIHFFITSRRSLKSTLNKTKKDDNPLNEWKLKYFNDIEARDKELSLLRQKAEEAIERAAEAEENSKIYSIEAEELGKQVKKLTAELQAAGKHASKPAHDRQDYYEQLRLAQESLLEHNEKISMLLSNIDVIKETEEKQKEIMRDNEELSTQIKELRSLLAEKEREVNTIRQKAHLSKEMSSMLDSTYNEFNTLQAKIHKLESQVTSSKVTGLEHEDLKEAHYKLKKDYEEQKQKLNGVTIESQHLQSAVEELEHKLRESNFQRQQLQKRVAHLEELNNDLQEVSDANKRLEGQIKRIGELESMLNVISEERDQLIRKQV
jgi:chromosome segregation ATPase